MKIYLFNLSICMMFLVSCEEAKISNISTFSGNGAISCSKQNCFGVGSYTLQSFGSSLIQVINTGPFIAKIQTNDGTCSTRDIQLTLPNDISSPNAQSQLRSISCFTQGNQEKCLAVGNYTKIGNTTNALAPLVMLSIDGGQSFFANNTINSYLPDNTELGDEESVSLNSVTCSNQQCIIVGSYKTEGSGSAGQTLLILLSTDGGDTFSPVLPETLPANIDQTIDATSGLSSISCLNNHCVAVGSYRKQGGIPGSSFEAPLVLISNDKGQSFDTLGTVLLPTDAGDAFATLQNVTCTKDACVAVGTYQTTAQQISSNGQNPLSVYSTDGGKTFTSTSVPLPNDAVTPGFNALQAVNCTAQNICVAVGSYQKPLLAFAPQIIRSTDTGVTWPTIVTPAMTLTPPLGTPENADLLGIACLGSFCVSVGGYKPNTNETRIPLVVLSADIGETFSMAGTCQLPADADTSNRQSACFGACPSS